MMTGNVFISYSREQLYFAEALSLRLQKAGIPVWMDLQQLQPGGDWAEQINTALQKCASLVLVASRKALNSPYVQKEWSAALHTGKPVFIALYEEVDLPPILKSVSLVDFRGSFKRAVNVLADALKQDRAVHELTPRPGWLNLPKKLPPWIQLSAWLLIIEALITPLIAPLIRFPIISPLVWFVNCLLLSGSLLWMWWGLLHHRQVYQSGFAALLIPFFYYAFHRFSAIKGMGLSDEFFGWWMGYILFVGGIQSVLYLFVGNEFLRWSVPGEDAGVQIMRRWFNKTRRGKRKDVPAPDFRSILTARDSTTAGVSSVEVLHQQKNPAPLQTSTIAGTYSLCHAPADRSIAMSVRRAFGKQNLREVDAGGETRIAILTENLPRSELKRLLDSRTRAIILLAGNVAVKGDDLLERALHLQLIDYRDRSEKILPALARTLKNPGEFNLPVGVETTPKPIDAHILPPGARGAGFFVLALGAFLVISGLVSLAMVYMGGVYRSPTDLIGLPVGLTMINLGGLYWRRRTVNLLFTPALIFSIWLGMAILFTSFFLYGEPLLSDRFGFVLTFSQIFSLEGWVCFSAPSLIFIPIIIIGVRPRLRDWLPVTARKAVKGDRFPPMPDPTSRSWVWKAWLLAVFIAFGLEFAMYGVFYFISNVMVGF